MATAADVERSLKALAATLARSNPEPGTVPERAILCVVPDLDRTWWAELRDGRLRGIRAANGDERSDARITASSDDLIDLIEGRLAIGLAFLTGRVRIDASPRDLMLLRKLF